jgi:hypothetical protein
MAHPSWQVTVAPDMNRPGEITGTIHGEGCTTYDIAHGVIRWAAMLLGQPNRTIPTQAQLEAMRREVAIRDAYPAVRWARLRDGTPVFLCPACVDVYADRVHDLDVIPPILTGPHACTFHLDPSRAPMSYEEAAARANMRDAGEDSNEDSNISISRLPRPLEKQP